MSRIFHLTVNGRAEWVDADPDTSLLEILRNRLGLVGARFGCGLGLCGACFVQIDGTSRPSCDTPIHAVEGRTVRTVEGLAGNDGPHPVLRALLEEQAAQCGFCIPGIAVTAAALLETNPRPDESDVVAALDRNLCRCGAQQRIVRAVVRAGESS